MSDQTKKETWLGCVGCLSIVFVIAFAFLLTRHQISAPYRAIEEEYAAMNGKFHFEAGSTNALSPEQLDRYLAIRVDLVPKLEAIVNAIATTRADKAREGGGLFLGIRAGRELTKLDRELKAQHVSLLRTHKMSLSEYRWIARRAFAALREGATTSRPQFGRVWNQVTGGFRQGAPRIAKYRKTPPDLASRLRLDSVHPSGEDVSLIELRLDQLFEPYQTLYHEASLLTEENN